MSHDEPSPSASPRSQKTRVFSISGLSNDARILNDRRTVNTPTMSYIASINIMVGLFRPTMRVKFHIQKRKVSIDDELIDNECDSVTARERVASQTERVSVNGVNEIEKSETVEWAGLAFIVEVPGDRRGTPCRRPAGPTYYLDPSTLPTYKI